MHSIRRPLALAVPVLVIALAFIPNASAGSPPYRRWISPKVLTCSTTGPGVQAAIDNQNVEFNNLQADDEFTINYVLNGVTTTDGPFTVEQTSGTRNYGAFSQGFPSYPFTFEFRLDTLVDGEVVYTSTLDLGCTADGTRTVNADNVVVGPASTTTTTSTTAAPGSSTTVTAPAAARPATAATVTPAFTG